MIVLNGKIISSKVAKVFSSWFVKRGGLIFIIPKTSYYIINHPSKLTRLILLEDQNWSTKMFPTWDQKTLHDLQIAFDFNFRRGENDEGAG